MSHFGDAQARARSRQADRRAEELGAWWSDLDAKLSTSQIPGLYGVRAVAVGLVIAYHFGFEINGAMGVQIFFTLSGFLITTLLLREIDATGTISFREFYIRRTKRIFPALYVFLVVCVAILLLRRREVPWPDVIAASLYVQNYLAAIAHRPDTVVSHTWSLAIEEQFYLLWPIVAYRFRRDTRSMAKALVALIAVAWAARQVLHYGFDVGQSYIYHAFETRMDQLAVGCLLAVLLRERMLHGLWRFACASPIAPALVIAALAASSLLHGSNAYRFTVGYTIEPVLTAVLLVQLIVLSGHRVWGLFNSAPMLFLGRISYSLYLYQQITLYTARRLTADYPVVVQFGFAVACTVLAAWASYTFVEQRFRGARAS